MGYPNTDLQKKLGTQAMVAGGNTQGLDLSNMAIRGLYFLITLDKSAGSVPTIAECKNAIDQVRVNIDGSDDYNMKGSTLYYLNRRFLNGQEVPTKTEATALVRTIGLYLPFEFEGGIKSQDTLLDLRRRMNGSLPKAYVQFRTSLPANTAGSIDVYEDYYTFAQKERKAAYRKQIIEKTLTVTAGGSFIVSIPYGAPPDDIARMMIYTENSSGVLQTPTLRDLKLVASEDQQYEIFNVEGISTNSYAGIEWIFNKMNPISDDLDGVIFRDFCPTDATGRLSKIVGAVDASDMTDLSLQGTSGSAGELTVMLERIGLQKPANADPYAGV